MNRIKQHEKCICILQMIDKMTEKIWEKKKFIIINDKKPFTQSYLFESKTEAENKVSFLENCLSRLHSYYAKNVIKTIQ